MARSGTDALILDLESVPDDARWTAPEGVTPVPFPPLWAHRIVTIGYAWLGRADRLERFEVIARPTGDPDAVERGLIENLSALIAEARPTLVTYNGRGFDLPVIALRALCHGLALPWYYRDRNVRARHSDDGHLDLCDWLADHGAIRSGSLDALTRLVGLPGKLGVDGSQVEAMHRAGELDAIERYCLSDVAQTAFLYLRVRLLSGRLDRDSYRARATALYEAFAADGRVAPVLDATARDRLLLAA